MKTVQRWGRVSWLAILALSVAACSSGGDSGPSTSPDTSGAGETSEDRTYDISFMGYSYAKFPEPDGAGVQAIREKFNANIESQYILNSDFNSKLSVVMASGDMPDVVHISANDSNYYKWARQGAFLPLDEYLDQFESFRNVPDSIWDQFRVDGKIYSIPMYAATYSFSNVVRQDWLDNLGLEVPTSYEELLEVAIAFTKDDPDQNGVDDTYGFAMGENVSPDYAAGAYWSGGWYHQDEEGNYIPGVIGPGRREVIETLAEAYKQGAVTKDFAVLNWAQANKEFYSGKAGIFIGTPSGMVEEYYLGLLEVNPEARITSIPHFVAPDGSQGRLLNQGYFGLTTLSAELKNDPDKVMKILEILDYGRQFIPLEERTPDNEHFDWLMGGEGVGYDMVDGKAVPKPGSESIAPIGYMFQREEYRPTAPNDEANQYSKAAYNDPRMQQFISQIEEMEATYNQTPYADPSRGIFSEVHAQKGAELTQFITGEITKMISGQRPVEEWDTMVEEWKARGGAEWIKEVNEGIKERSS